MTDDDWEPLPSGDLCARPGETCELAKKVPQPTPPPPPPAPPPAPPAPPDPAAERALAELRQKLAVAAPATSLIATVQHRELRSQRKRKAPPVACAETVVRTTKPADALLAEVQCAEGAKKAGEPPDPREKEAWFRKLPETERERLKARWWLVQHRHDGTGLVLRLRLQRALVYGGLCFFVVSLLQSMLIGGFAYVPIFVAAGALAAGIAEICNGGRIVYAAAGTAAFLAVMGPGVVAQPLSLVGLLIAAYGMGTIGMDGEMRRSGGFPEK